MKFKVTYAEGDVINKTTEIEADTKTHAMTLFYLDNPNCELLKIEAIENNG